jgi:DNA modification methylase
MATHTAASKPTGSLQDYLPQSVRQFATSRDVDLAIPTIAKTRDVLMDIAAALRRLPTHHRLHQGDARNSGLLDAESVHLAVTSPPYWTLKRYNASENQLGHMADYNEFLDSLDAVWRVLFDALVPGGRLVCVVGDVCLSRRKNNGEHTCVPLHSSIQERCRRIGFSNLAPIIWHKIANASYEVEGNSRFLGKPYEPNGVIKNDIEYIVMLRKPGGYRKPTLAARLLSVIGDDDHKRWFRQIWSDVTGASTQHHPAPFPLELASRLVRMFSFAGDTVVDPFMGTATTNLAAAIAGRNSIGIETDPEYMRQSIDRMQKESADLFSDITLTTSED